MRFGISHKEVNMKILPELPRNVGDRILVYISLLLFCATFWYLTAVVIFGESSNNIMGPSPEEVYDVEELR